MIRVNGKEIQFKSSNLLDFLLEQGYNPDRVAVELNEVIIKKSMYSETMLSDGDKVEIVCFVGGG